jgi:hypothetical protein
LRGRNVGIFLLLTYFVNGTAFDGQCLLSESLVDRGPTTYCFLDTSIAVWVHEAQLPTSIFETCFFLLF